MSITLVAVALLINSVPVHSNSRVSVCEHADANFTWIHSSPIRHIRWSKIYFNATQKVHITKYGHMKTRNENDLTRYEVVYRTEFRTHFLLKNVSQQDSGVYKHTIVTEEGDICDKEWTVHVKESQTKIRASWKHDGEGCYKLKCGDSRPHIWFYEDNTQLEDTRICDDDVTVWCRIKHGCIRSHPLYLPPFQPENLKESTSTSSYAPNDQEDPWESSTAPLCYSSGKLHLAVLFALLVEYMIVRA